MKVLCIGDLHLPFEHIDAYSFVSEIKKSYKPDKIIYIGDEIDYHSFNFHEKEVDEMFSPAEELELSIERLSRFYELTPNATLMESNHGSLVYRRAKFNGLPRYVIKSYQDLLQTPRWAWKEQETIDGVRYCHQTSGAASFACRTIGMSVVQGHNHTKMGIEYIQNEVKLMFSAYTGCLIDRDKYAFKYARANVQKPALGLLLVTDGIPTICPMILDSKGRWKG